MPHHGFKPLGVNGFDVVIDKPDKATFGLLHCTIIDRRKIERARVLNDLDVLIFDLVKISKRIWIGAIVVHNDDF